MILFKNQDPTEHGAHTWDPSTVEAAGLQVQGQRGKYSEMTISKSSELHHGKAVWPFLGAASSPDFLS